MNKQQLRISFGKDQETGIDNLLAEMKAEGTKFEVEKHPLVTDHVGYDITFENVYDAYLFGHRSADLMKYFFYREI